MNLPVVQGGKCQLFERAVRCRWCRSHPEWRAQLGIPDECPHGVGTEIQWGDLVAKIATPIARALKLGCIDPATNDLKPESGCAKRKARMNGEPQ